jgi:hypothetical protein
MSKNMLSVVLGALAALAFTSGASAGDAEELVSKSNVGSSAGMQSAANANGIIGTGYTKPGGIIGTGYTKPGGIIGTGYTKPGGIIGTGYTKP